MPNTPNRVTLPALAGTRRRAQRVLDQIPADSGMLIVDAGSLVETTTTFIDELIRQSFVVLQLKAVIFVGLTPVAKHVFALHSEEYKDKVYFDIDWREI